MLEAGRKGGNGAGSMAREPGSRTRREMQVGGRSPAPINVGAEKQSGREGPDAADRAAGDMSVGLCHPQGLSDLSQRKSPQSPLRRAVRCPLITATVGFTVTPLPPAPVTQQPRESARQDHALRAIARFAVIGRRTRKTIVSRLIAALSNACK